MASTNTPIQKDFFNQDEEDIIKSVLNSDEKGVNGLFTGLFAELEQEVGIVINKTWEQIRWEKVSCEDIDAHIYTISSNLEEIFIASNMFTLVGIEKILSSIKYRVYLYWIKEVLSDSGFEFDGEVNDVPNELSEEIYNLLQTKRLTSFFLFLKSYGILDYSDNIINQFEEEREIKLLELDKQDLISKLELIGAKKVFEGELQDDYFDYPNLQLDRGTDNKRSFRIRKRTHIAGNSDHFYTIKRKINGDDRLRLCYEKEFEIKEFDLFTKVLERFGLRNSRSKTQNRVSYQIVQDDIKIKFDICTYEGIPTFLEIECDSETHISEFIEKLGLSDLETLKTGSRGLYRRYEMYDQYDTNYTISDDDKKIIWNTDGAEYSLIK